MIVIINIALLLFVFAAQKKKKSPYAAALALGVIKTGIYILWTSRIVLALGMGIIFAALAAGIIFLLGRIDRPRGVVEETVPTYTVGGADTIELRWEYVPLTLLMLILLGGEMCRDLRLGVDILQAFDIWPQAILNRGRQHDDAASCVWLNIPVRVQHRFDIQGQLGSGYPVGGGAQEERAGRAFQRLRRYFTKEVCVIRMAQPAIPDGANSLV